MNYNEIIEKYGIKIVARAKITDEKYEITKYGDLENNDIYDLYVKKMSINDMVGFLSGKILPSLLSQGNNHAVVCKHDEYLILYFLNKECNGVELYYISKELDKL